MKNKSWKGNNTLGRFKESGRKNLYDRVCHVLTDYEHNGGEETDGEVISPEEFNEIFYDTLYDVSLYLEEDYDDDSYNYPQTPAPHGY